ncbi:MAG TPA: chemotaxis protein CheW [Anaerolineae bacterium]|nr:chemotaxis protein CheW [Anaerolineae bacterium]
MNLNNDTHATKCWQYVGIYGDSTCTELEKVKHCRNCPAYIKAAKSLFDYEIPKGYRKEQTKLIASSVQTEIPGTTFIIVFRLGNEWLALKSEYVQEVKEILPVHSVPFRSTNMLKGLVNINGELIPCISVTDIFGLSGDIEEHPQHIIYKRMIVVIKNGERFVFPVDEILGIRRISIDKLQKIPATLSKSSKALTRGILKLNEKVIGLLDEVKFFESLQRSLVF